MKCNNCSKTIKRPLELYDGEFGCPHCKKRGIVGVLVKRPCVTKSNAEEYKLSEIMFYQWLTRNAAYKDKGDKLLDEAVAFCKSAACKGHPEAILRLGYYYDKDFADINRTEADRCKIAAAYYRTVIDTAADGYEAEGDEPAPDANALMAKAVKLLLAMLRNAPAEIKSNYNLYVQRIPTDLLRQYSQDDNGSAVGIYNDKSDQIYQVISETQNKVRAPIAGVMYCTGLELKLLFELHGQEIFDMLQRYGKYSKGLSLIYGKSDAHGQYRELQALSNPKLIMQALGSIKDDDKVCLYFFNNRGGHRFFSARALSTLQREFEKRTEDRVFDRVRTFMTNARKNIVLYDDDIFINKKQFKLSKALDATLTYIGK